MKLPKKHVLASRNRCLQKIGKMTDVMRAIFYGVSTVAPEKNNLIDSNGVDNLIDSNGTDNLVES